MIASQYIKALGWVAFILAWMALTVYVARFRNQPISAPPHETQPFASHRCSILSGGASLCSTVPVLAESLRKTKQCRSNTGGNGYANGEARGSTDQDGSLSQALAAVEQNLTPFGSSGEKRNASCARTRPDGDAKIGIQGSVTLLPSSITDRFLDALEQIESGGSAKARGRKDEAGSFQFRAIAWRDCNRIRTRLGLAGVRWDSVATNRAVARSCARTMMRWLEARLRFAMHRQPNAGELYGAWNLGFDGFRKRHFRLQRCPPTTRDAAGRFSNLIDNEKLRTKK